MAAALPLPEPQHGEILRPIHALRSALVDAAEKYGKPTIGRYRRTPKDQQGTIALFFGEHSEIVFAFSGLGYKFVQNELDARYGLNEVHAILKEYVNANGWNGVKPIDAMAWLADRYAQPPTLPRIARDSLRQYERHFSTACRWTAALKQAERAAIYADLSATANAHYLDMRGLMRGMG
jgi:hypothetical protein